MLRDSLNLPPLRIYVSSTGTHTWSSLWGAGTHEARYVPPSVEARVGRGEGRKGEGEGGEKRREGKEKREGHYIIIIINIIYYPDNRSCVLLQIIV